jgi:NAD(P) transhydrogenase subunit alpha
VRVQVGPPEPASLPEGTAVIALAGALAEPERMAALAARRIDVVALELIPRVTRAQAMDVLSSHASIAGYWAAVAAAARLPKLFPMMMTAAGVIAPARVLVLGAGGAGLQAIATARRLGAVVEAFDVRRAVKEEVLSLGARFVEVEGDDAAGEGGYAREASDAERARQREVVARHLAACDVAITTAQVPGRRAPVLITDAMLQAMRPGSVVIDLAADQGGNVEGTEPGSEATRHGVLLVGHRNVPSFLAVHASQVFSKNVESLLAHLSGPDGALRLDGDDEITRGALVCRGGAVVHPRVLSLLDPGKEG